MSGALGALLCASGPARAIATPATPLFALVDIDTPGARDAYEKFRLAIGRRFAGAKVMPETRFVAAVQPADKDSNERLRETLLTLRPRIVTCANAGLASDVRRFELGVPMLFFSADDPIAFGLTESLVRPGQGMTGFTLGINSTLKRQEMLLRLAPHCRVMGQIVNAEHSDEGLKRAPVSLPSPWTHVEQRKFSCNTPDELAAILRRADARAADAWDVAYSGAPFRYADETVRQFTKLRRPVMYPRLRHVRLGGMAAYEPRIDEVWDVWAAQADSLLRGVPVVDIPVVQATRYSFGLNMKACRRVGIEPAKSLLKIADLVIE